MGRGVVRRALAACALACGLAVVSAAPARADPSVQDWSRLRACESSGRYDVVAASAHYGAYQFDLPTWRSVGGTGLPSAAPPGEQDFRALVLYRMRGWQPWECAGIVGLHPERDAATGRAPSRAQAAYMRPAAPGSGGAATAWPGRVFEPGDCDPALRAWQLRMNAWGYDFDGTGCYGDKTGRAAVALQRRYHFPATGRLGPRTWQAAWATPP